MIPKIFTNAPLWFKLWKAAVYQEGNGSMKSRAVYILTTDIDGEKHTITFIDHDFSKDLYLYVEVTGPLITQSTNGSPPNTIAFNIAYKLAYNRRGAEEGVCRLRGHHVPIYVLTKRFHNRTLPHVYKETDRDMIEHIVMMFVLSTNGVMS